MRRIIVTRKLLWRSDGCHFGSWYDYGMAAEELGENTASKIKEEDCDVLLTAQEYEDLIGGQDDTSLD